jgi:SOS response regulatory protein OraA/RecX
MGRGTQLNGANYHTPHLQAKVPQLNGPAIASLAHILKQQRNTKSRIFMKKAKETKPKEKDEVQELFTLAVKRLIARDYSPSKLKDYLLKKNENKQVVDIVIQKLKKYQLLNEDELIERIIEYCDSKHYGYNRIILMLKTREISIDKINKVKVNHERETKEAVEQTKRLVKRYKSKNTVNLKRSVYSALIRYGFDENIASLESSKVFNSPSSELNMLKLDYSKLVSRYSRKLKGKELYNKVVTALMSKGYRINDINKIIKEVD